MGQAILPLKGHEPMSLKALKSIAGLFFNFTFVKMKGHNKQFN